MAELTAERLAERAFDVNVLTDRQVQEAWAHFGRRNVPTEEFVQFLLRREFLTNWQAERLLKGDKSGYFCGEYKLLYSIGAGTFARVYRAVHRTTGQVVAAKVLRKRFSDNKEQAEHFCREGEMGIQLRHPNIVAVYEVFSRSPVHYLIMEFVEGQSLRDFLKVRKKFEPVYATQIIHDMLSGLAHAFERGITHRDVKPSNVLVSSQGKAKLVDFGLANAAARNEEEAQNPRTVDYVGLERATGVRRDDARSDIYFIGCIYYQLLTGVPPLSETKDRMQRMTKQRYTDVVPIIKADPTLPRPLTTIVTRAMELAPSLRYQRPGEMLAELNLAMRRMAEEAAGGGAGHDADALFEMWGDQARKILMFVESNQQMQDILRAGLKRSGYRVLMTRDPMRAIDRFVKDPLTADCLVFSTVELGEPALEAFNRFGSLEATKHIPAVLLLGELHTNWKERAKTDDKHLVVTSPIKLREFRAALYQIVPPHGERESEEAH